MQLRILDLDSKKRDLIKIKADLEPNRHYKLIIKNLNKNEFLLNIKLPTSILSWK